MKAHGVFVILPDLRKTKALNQVEVEHIGSNMLRTILHYLKDTSVFDRTD